MRPITSFILLSFLLSSCCEECDKIQGPWNTAVQMITSPETFDTYVQQNKSDFNSDFKDCVAQKIATLNKKIDEEHDRCTLTFSNNLPGYELCISGVNNEYSYRIWILETMQAVINGQIQFFNTNLGQELIYLQSEEPDAYAEIKNLYQTGPPNEWFVCEECEKKFLCIF